MSDYNPPTRTDREALTSHLRIYRGRMQAGVDALLADLKKAHDEVFDPEEMTQLIHEGFSIEYFDDVLVAPAPHNKRRLVVKVGRFYRLHKVSHKITVTSGMTVREAPDSARMFGAFDFS